MPQGDRNGIAIHEDLTVVCSSNLPRTLLTGKDGQASRIWPYAGFSMMRGSCPLG
jgi:hypothetical protein